MNNFLNHNWNTPHNIKSIITTRLGGVSLPPYNTLNLGNHVGDNLDLVLQNRQILTSVLSAQPYWLNQTHSDKIICLDDLIYDDKLILDYDASFTRQANKICVVMSADCIPILLTDINGSFAAAIHAGWRGVENNIIAKCITSIGALPSDILVYIAPSICHDHFEVGNDVFSLFIKQDTSYKDFFTEIGNGKFYCNLVSIAKSQLLKLGVVPANIYLSNQCTYCNDELFFSYRRDGVTGRMASLIWLSE